MEKGMIESLALDEDRLLKARTKKEGREIVGVYKKMSLPARELFVDQFGFNQVDKEYLELEVQEQLVELRIIGWVDCVYFSLGAWIDDHLISVYRGSDMNKVYYLVKVMLQMAS